MSLVGATDLDASCGTAPIEIFRDQVTDSLYAIRKVDEAFSSGGASGVGRGAAGRTRDRITGFVVVLATGIVDQGIRGGAGVAEA